MGKRIGEHHPVHVDPRGGPGGGVHTVGARSRWASGAPSQWSPGRCRPRPALHRSADRLQRDGNVVDGEQVVAAHGVVDRAAWVCTMASLESSRMATGSVVTSAKRRSTVVRGSMPVTTSDNSGPDSGVSSVRVLRPSESGAGTTTSTVPSSVVSDTSVITRMPVVGGLLQSELPTPAPEGEVHRTVHHGGERRGPRGRRVAVGGEDPASGGSP